MLNIHSKVDIKVAAGHVYEKEFLAYRCLDIAKENKLKRTEYMESVL